MILDARPLGCGNQVFDRNCLFTKFGRDDTPGKGSRSHRRRRIDDSGSSCRCSRDPFGSSAPPRAQLSFLPSFFCSFTEFFGDSYCDKPNNNAECGYDGGDCCECTCEVRIDLLTPTGLESHLPRNTFAGKPSKENCRHARCNSVVIWFPQSWKDRSRPRRSLGCMLGSTDELYSCAIIPEGTAECLLLVSLVPFTQQLHFSCLYSEYLSSVR